MTNPHPFFAQKVGIPQNSYFHVWFTCYLRFLALRWNIGLKYNVIWQKLSEMKYLKQYWSIFFKFLPFFGGFRTAPWEDLVNLHKSYVNDPMIVSYAFSPKALVEKPDLILFFYFSCSLIGHARPLGERKPLPRPIQRSNFLTG